jgi:hypothetical protein
LLTIRGVEANWESSVLWARDEAGSIPPGPTIYPLFDEYLGDVAKWQGTGSQDRDSRVRFSSSPPFLLGMRAGPDGKAADRTSVTDGVRFPEPAPLPSG